MCNSVDAVCWLYHLHKRHIAINVLYLMAGERGKWYLDLFAYVVGVIALWLLADDAIVRALDSIRMTEKMGSAWNSPQPLVLKTMLVIGALMYLVQLLVNMHRHLSSSLGKIWFWQQPHLFSSALFP